MYSVISVKNHKPFCIYERKGQGGKGKNRNLESNVSARRWKWVYSIDCISIWLSNQVSFSFIDAPVLSTKMCDILEPGDKSFLLFWTQYLRTVHLSYVMCCTPSVEGVSICISGILIKGQQTTALEPNLGLGHCMLHLQLRKKKYLRLLKKRNTVVWNKDHKGPEKPKLFTICASTERSSSIWFMREKKSF